MRKQPTSIVVQSKRAQAVVDQLYILVITTGQTVISLVISSEVAVHPGLWLGLRGSCTSLRGGSGTVQNSKINCQKRWGLPRHPLGRSGRAGLIRVHPKLGK